MRAVTEKIVNRNGIHSTTTHSMENEKAAPMTVQVMTAEGSRSAAPVMMPGPRRHSACQTVAGAAAGCGGKRTTLPVPRSAGVPLRDLAELTLQVSLDLAFVPPAQRTSEGDDAVGGDGGQHQSAGDTQKNVSRIGFGHALDYGGVARRDHGHE